MSLIFRSSSSMPPTDFYAMAYPRVKLARPDLENAEIIREVAKQWAEEPDNPKVSLSADIAIFVSLSKLIDLFVFPRRSRTEYQSESTRRPSTNSLLWFAVSSLLPFVTVASS